MTTAPPSDIVAEIQRLKKARNAVILAHNYERPEVQDLADVVGDSLYLSHQAAQTSADVIGPSTGSGGRVFPGGHGRRDPSPRLERVPSRRCGRGLR